MSNQSEALAICSEFAEQYGINVKDGKTIVVYMESKYVNELKNMLEKKEYKLYSFEAYGKDTLINFIPKSKYKF